MSLLFHSFYTLKTKEDLVNNPVAFCCLINFDFLLSHTAHFDKSIMLRFLVLAIFGFINRIKSSINLIMSLNFLFLLSFRFILLEHYLLKQIHHD